MNRAGRPGATERSESQTARDSKVL